MAKHNHDGHRDRMKRRFREHGLDSFETHEVLELLLFFGVPRQNTNELAHELLNTFGDFPGVLDASPRDLQRIKGIGPHTATLLNLCSALLERYHSDRQEGRRIFADPAALGEYLHPFFLSETKEKILLLTLNDRWELLGRTTLSTGTLSACEARAREIVEIALPQHATGVVLAHNHPYGFAVPSQEDIESTARLAETLRLVDIRLLDHLIFDNSDYVSLRQTPAFTSLFA